MLIVHTLQNFVAIHIKNVVLYSYSCVNEAKFCRLLNNWL